MTQKLKTNIYLGSILIFISIIDVSLNSFYKINFTNFLPDTISFLLPLVLGFIGLHLIRIEYSGIRRLDEINKNLSRYLRGQGLICVILSCYYAITLFLIMS